MITMEFQNGQEVFAVDDNESEPCHGCVFKEIGCGTASCTPAHRQDHRTVHFTPINDFKTNLLYALQLGEAHAHSLE